eukprot:9202702-Heterocapsa_arctica.AAC.1
MAGEIADSGYIAGNIVRGCGQVCHRPGALQARGGKQLSGQFAESNVDDHQRGGGQHAWTMRV